MPLVVTLVCVVLTSSVRAGREAARRAHRAAAAAAARDRVAPGAAALARRAEVPTRPNTSRQRARNQCKSVVSCMCWHFASVGVAVQVSSNVLMLAI